MSYNYFASQLPIVGKLTIFFCVNSMTIRNKKEHFSVDKPETALILSTCGLKDPLYFE
jgi:hypothetical protein